MSLMKTAVALAFAAVIAGCSIFPPADPVAPGQNSLAPYPDGTVDTTHGAAGSQTSPR